MMGDVKKRMRQRFTIALFNNTDFSRKHLTLPGYMAIIICLAAVSATALVGFLFFQSRILDHSLPSPETLQRRIAHDQKQAYLRKQQIALLEEKLDALENKLSRLEDFEHQVRNIARIEPDITEDNLFGVGGTRHQPANATGNNRNEPVAKALGKSRLDSASGMPPAGSNRQTGLTLVLDQADFSINPITCIPDLLPVTTSASSADSPARIGEVVDLRKDESGYRRGIALSAETDADVVAPASGIITYANDSPDSEQCLVIDHGHGYITRYTGLARICREPGESVNQGDRIGKLTVSSETGPASNHFYYEILLNGLPVNPEKYLAHGPFLL